MCPEKDKETGMYAFNFNIEENLGSKRLSPTKVGRLGNGLIGSIQKRLRLTMQMVHASRLATTRKDKSTNK
jgi:hypothetical protein